MTFEPAVGGTESPASLPSTGLPPRAASSPGAALLRCSPPLLMALLMPPTGLPTSALARAGRSPRAPSSVACSSSRPPAAESCRLGVTGWLGSAGVLAPSSVAAPAAPPAVSTDANEARLARCGGPGAAGPCAAGGPGAPRADSRMPEPAREGVSECTVGTRVGATVGRGGGAPPATRRGGRGDARGRASRAEPAAAPGGRAPRGVRVRGDASAGAGWAWRGEAAAPPRAKVVDFSRWRWAARGAAAVLARRRGDGSAAGLVPPRGDPSATAPRRGGAVLPAPSRPAASRWGIGLKM